MNTITLDSIAFAYAKGRRSLPVLTNASLTATPAENIAIVGRSGGGKSTILDLISGILTPQSGSVTVLGSAIHTLGENDRAALRLRSIGRIFQHFDLFPHLTAQQNVAVPLRLNGVSAKDAHARAAEALTNVGLGNRIEHRPTELSGGEQQRVAIARALIGNPEIVLADEPTGALDAEIRDEILDLIAHVTANATLVVVTHDLAVAERLKCRTLRLADGELTAA